MPDTFALTAASLSVGFDVLDMLHDIGPGENGFTNRAHDLDRHTWSAYLADLVRYADGIDLPAEHVPQTTYWLRRDGYPVGLSKLRHTLNDALAVYGGHVGYCVRPVERGKGYGHVLLGSTLAQAHHLGIAQVLITTNRNNLPSRAMVERHGGVLEPGGSGYCRYWVPSSG